MKKIASIILSGIFYLYAVPLPGYYLAPPGGMVNPCVCEGQRTSGVPIEELLSGKYKDLLKKIFDLDSSGNIAFPLSIQGFQIKETDTLNYLFTDPHIPPYVKYQFHEVLIVPFIAKYYTGENKGLYSRFGQNKGDKEKLEDIKNFFEKILEFKEAVNLIEYLMSHENLETKPAGIHILYVGKEKTLIESYASKEYGINICNSCLDVDSAVVHQIMALLGSSDHSFNIRVVKAYQQWRKTRKISSELQHIKDIVHELLIAPEEYFGITDIYDPYVFRVNDTKNPRLKKVKPFESNKSMETVLNMATSLKDLKDKDKLINSIPVIVASCGSENNELQRNAFFLLNLLVSSLPQIWLDEYFKEFQLQGIAIEDDRVSGNLHLLFKRKYFEQWSSNLTTAERLLSYQAQDQDIEMEIMFKEVAIFSNRALYFDDKGLSDLADVAFRKAFLLFQKYIRKYSLLYCTKAPDYARKVYDVFYLNTSDLSYRITFIKINEMLIALSKDSIRCKKIGVEFTSLENAYIEYCKVLDEQKCGNNSPAIQSELSNRIRILYSNMIMISVKNRDFAGFDSDTVTVNKSTEHSVEISN